MNDTESCVHVCNKLLRGEISAIESYNKALEKVEEAAVRGPLQSIREDHQRSVEDLRQHISSMGAVPDTDSGPWGTFTQAVTGVAGLMGESPAVSALIQGEEHGIREYEEALEDPQVMSEAKATFRETLLPRLRKHVAELETLPA